MKTYRIMNRITKQWWEGEAQSAQEACQKAGWMIGDCWVRIRTPGQGGEKSKETKGNQASTVGSLIKERK